MQLLRPATTRASAAEVMHLLVQNSVEIQRSCVNAFAPLESLLRCAFPRTAGVAAAMAIAGLCEHSENRIEAVKAGPFLFRCQRIEPVAGCVGPLVDMVYSPDWKRQRAASLALGAISNRGKSLRHCAIIADSGGVNALVMSTGMAQTAEGRLSVPFLMTTLGYLCKHEYFFFSCEVLFRSLRPNTTGHCERRPFR